MVFPLTVVARHAQPCSLHEALRALGTQAPRRPAPGQQVSTTPSAAEGAEGERRGERTPRLPSASGEGRRLLQSLLLLVFQFASAWKLEGVFWTAVPKAPFSPHLLRPDFPSCPSPKSSERMPPPLQPEAGFPRPARALHCGGYQDAKTAQPIVSGSRSAPKRQPMGVQINHLKHPMN